MERILQNRPATITATFYDQDGQVVDPGTVTVTVTRADGTTVSTGTATGTGAAARTYALTTTDTASLDTFTAAWVSSGQGTVTTTVEVAGDVLFTVPEARAIRPLDNAVDYPTADIKEMRTTVEQSLEEHCGAFVPRYSIVTVTVQRGETVVPGLPLIRKIRSVTVDGVALTGADLTAVTTDGVAVYSSAWGATYGRCTPNTAVRHVVTVGFEHGRQNPPERVRRAALLLAKIWLVSGPVDDRTSTFSTNDGGTFALVTPGRGGSVFGVPEVDAVVQQYQIPTIG